METSDLNTAVSTSTLSQLAKVATVPQYDRAALRPGIVHIGVGGFNRAHQAVYLDDLLTARAACEADGGIDAWAQCGVGLLPGDRRMRDVLQQQDYMYTVVERSAQTRSARVIGSICDYVFAPEAPEAALARMASPECRIVSMTVTEGGYFTCPGASGFEDSHPDVLHDLENPLVPRTFLGFICEALDRRRRAGLAPFTVSSCDNLQGNGDTAAKVVSAFAEMRDPSLRRWIEENVTFPNSMVDRITPATTEAERIAIEQRFGIRDGWPVVTEPFRQWVLEDKFCNGRPPWELVGVLMTDEVEPFELMKMRLLNGSHFAMAYIGAVLGFEFVHDFMADPLMRQFIHAYMDAVTPAVPPVPGVDLAQYKATLIERFSNPTIGDQITRICTEGAAKVPRFVLPALLELNRKGEQTRLLSLVVAGWIHYLAGKDEQGKPLTIVDAREAELTPLVARPNNPEAVLGFAAVFGDELPSNPRLVAEVRAALQSMKERGVQQTIREYLL